METEAGRLEKPYKLHKSFWIRKTKGSSAVVRVLWCSSDGTAVILNERVSTNQVTPWGSTSDKSTAVDRDIARLSE